MTRVTQQHVDARRESILDAAARLFARQGLNGATMADIAREADLSAGAIYRYFSSKDELLRAVFDEASTRSERLFQEELESASSPFSALKRIGRRVWVDIDDRDELICEVQMALTAARDPGDFGIDLSQKRRLIRQLLEQTIRAAQEAGEIDPELDPKILALIIHASTAGMQMLKLDEDVGNDVEAAFELMVRMVQGLSSEQSSSTKGD